LFRNQIAEDNILIEKYRALHNDSIERARKAQQAYLTFEKNYFEELQKSSVERKQSIRNQGSVPN
jgi:hypothetical protein